MSNIVELAKLYDELINGMVKPDTKLMREILDDSFQLILTTGDGQSKNDWISAIDKNEIIYHTAKTEHLEITPKGDSAVVLGQTHVEVTSARHPRMPFNLQQTLKVSKVNGKWKITESAAAVY